MGDKQKPTSYHVAQLAGVSRTTVSFVLNNRMDVAIPQKTRDAVLDAARRLGYRPNRAACALASSTKNGMAFWLTSLSSVVYLNWIQHMQAVAEAKGLDLIFSEKPESNRSPLEQHGNAEWPVDGIFAYSLQWLPAYLETHPFHSPTVLMGYYFCPGMEKYDYVGLDLYTPTAECMKSLIRTGRRRMVYFQSQFSQGDRSPRFQAYRDNMLAAGLETEVLTNPGVSRVSAYDVLREYTEQRGFPDALVCCNDDFAIASLRLARDKGLSVPDDLAIAGSDGLEDTCYHEPRVTTIELPYKKMCDIAWEMMERRIDDPAAEPWQTLVPATLKMRESTLGTSGNCIVSDLSHDNASVDQ